MAIEIEAELVHDGEGKEAFCIVVDGNDENQVWVPKKLGSYVERPRGPHLNGMAVVVDVTLPSWFAKREGLI